VDVLSLLSQYIAVFYDAQSGGCKDTDLEVSHFTSIAHKMTILSESVIHLTATSVCRIENFPNNH
jgi:hypothetical protein